MKTKLFIMLIALLVFSGNNNVNAQQRMRKPQKRTVVKKPVSKQQAHQAIDLGLPSGTKWASCNVGANKPEEYGDYYAWGETTTKKEYTYDNYLYYKNGKYLNIGADISGTQYDVARAKWGGKWRIPTKDEVKELVDNCKYEWTTLNGVKGGKFTGPNGNSIFLPAAGYRWYGDLDDAGEGGNYWSSAQYPGYSGIAYCLGFGSGNAYWYYGYYRYYGRSVRPVTN